MTEFEFAANHSRLLAVPAEDRESQLRILN
jgi:hypothetical protein